MGRRGRWVETELLRLWRKAYGQPPAVMAEPRLMLELLRDADACGKPAGRRRRSAGSRSQSASQGAPVNSSARASAP